eukprot:SAG31_NODE_38242_length_297_cov_4.964646_1_plen_20_part_01
MLVAGELEAPACSLGALRGR